MATIGARGQCRALLRSALVTAVLALLLAPGPANAVPPNDTYANREVIPTLNFYDTVDDIETATVDPADPPFICRGDGPAPGGNTVWYSYTTGADTQYVNLVAVGLDAMLAVYDGTPVAATMAFGGCNDDFVVQNSHAGIYGMRLRPDTTYTIELATWAPVTTGSVDLIFEHAHVWRVNRTADTDDGICDDTDCSLRDAIESSNQSGSVVLVPAGTYRLAGRGDDDNATGDFDVRRGYPIYGAGPGQTIIDAEGIPGLDAGRIRVLDGGRGAAPAVDIQIGDGDPQRTITHEAGHMFGLDDEYASPPLGTSPGTGTGGGNIGGTPLHGKLAGHGIAPARFQNDDGIMSIGNVVEPQHYVTFLDALNRVAKPEAFKYGGAGPVPPT